VPEIEAKTEMMGPIMPLSAALSYLAKAHTQDDDLLGFCVSPHMINPDLTGVSQLNYVQAWRSVRHALGQVYDPQEVGPEQ